MNLKQIFPMTLCLALAGCYSTAAVRQQAGKLADDVVTYRQEQKQRITNINQEYRDTYTRLMDNFAELMKVELQQGRNDDVQQIADQIIGDRENFTRRGDFRRAFAAAVEGQRARIAQADLAVGQAKASYAAAYREAALELAHLDRAEANLRGLAADEDRQKTFQDFVQTVVKVYEDLKKQTDQKSAAKAQNGAASN